MADDELLGDSAGSIYGTLKRGTLSPKFPMRLQSAIDPMVNAMERKKGKKKSGLIWQQKVERPISAALLWAVQ